MSILDSIKEAESQAATQRQAATVAGREMVQQAQTNATQQVEELVADAQRKAAESVDVAAEKAQAQAEKQVEQSAQQDEVMVQAARGNLSKTAQFIVERVQS